MKRWLLAFAITACVPLYGDAIPVTAAGSTARSPSSLANWVGWNHGLPALGVWGARDANAGSLLGAFDF